MEPERPPHKTLNSRGEDTEAGTVNSAPIGAWASAMRTPRIVIGITRDSIQLPPRYRDSLPLCCPADLPRGYPRRDGHPMAQSAV